MSTLANNERFLDHGRSSAQTAAIVEQLRRLRASRPAGSSGAWKWILMALQDSRRREATQIVARYRHLIQSDAGKPGAAAVRSPAPMSTQPMQRRATISRILLVTIVAFFAAVHGIALQRMEAVNGIGRSTSDTTLPSGD